MNWLFKEEPTHYNYDELVRDGKTTWTGVRNPLAQKHLRTVVKGDPHREDRSWLAPAGDQSRQSLC